MLDGAELGKAIAAHRDDVEAALAEYEEAMFARSATAAVEAAKIFKLCFQDDNVPYGLLEFFTGNFPPT
jgi:acyl-CoA reductase-like NAD-dependent aldehyde dehydrogenase